MDTNLTGKHALVCGSTQGIGNAVAMEFARLGARVTLLARNADKLKAAVALLDTRQGQEHGILAVDMANTDALQKALAQLMKNGPVDILVNNTGGPPPGLAHEADTATFADAFRLHLLSYQTLVRAVVPHMKEQKSGRIINVISTSVKQPLPNLGVSNTIRGAVANWAKTLATELGPYGITVNNVLPGATGTERLAAIVKNKATKSGTSEDAASTAMKNEIPLRRFAEPEEIAYAVAFLAGPSGAYVNGINLPVDGGRTACL
ncbi:MAG: SDR family oxidoreductase [Flavobacteriales bacterium]|nr:SDR family oxidoreductase [Flavobacteriales bacterium]MBK6944534.1 SDR family oxidoreductase [Flavobacteriales bacterium]MBK7241315.1 SDR family oxidoreductase [Flavobacteriales bacterium]MBK7298175.1 SDR family oxidoreductase [Flavobacteriales bacterium]MBK9534190.1 SDR family oxidoreductase [Flavobacteriales bacterium]